MRRRLLAVVLGGILSLAAPARGAAQVTLALPPRAATALAGDALAAAVTDLPRPDREARIVAEVLGGNVPSWWRELAPVTMTRAVSDHEARVTFWATPDYLALGSDDDWFLMPLSPGAAQRIADATRTSLPTPPMVDAIWSGAAARIGPDSIAPSAAMITVPVFADHMRMIRARRAALAGPHDLTAGHKKDVVLSARLDTLPDRVAIYGWHRPDGTPIQPLWTGHTVDHVDYSHGIRLVWHEVTIDGVVHEITDVLRDPALAAALSDEGPLRRARY